MDFALFGFAFANLGRQWESELYASSRALSKGIIPFLMRWPRAEGYLEVVRRVTRTPHVEPTQPSMPGWRIGAVSAMVRNYGTAPTPTLPRLIDRKRDRIWHLILFAGGYIPPCPARRCLIVPARVQTRWGWQRPHRLCH